MIDKVTVFSYYLGKMYRAFVVLTLLLCGSQLSAIAAEPQHITIDRSKDGSISHTVSRFSVPFLGDQTGKEPVSYHYVKDIPRPLYRLAQLKKVTLLLKLSKGCG